MTWFEFLLALHLLAIVTWVGGGLTMHVFALRARASGDEAAIAYAFTNAGWIGQRL